MLPSSLTHAQVLDRLWRACYGPTGFSCRCGCTLGYARAGGRSKLCRDCRAEVSVTAGTLMRGTHLPLTAWVYVLECRDHVPSAREVADLFEIAVSSAWHLVQRVLLWYLTRAVQQSRHSEVARIALRAAASAMNPGAPAHIVALDRAGAAEVGVRFDIAGDLAWCGPIGVGAPASAAHPAVVGLVDQLRARGYVSLRWLPRWAAALLGQRALPRGDAAVDWVDMVRSTRPIPLHRLDPWLA